MSSAFVDIATIESIFMVFAYHGFDLHVVVWDSVASLLFSVYFFLLLKPNQFFENFSSLYLSVA